MSFFFAFFHVLAQILAPVARHGWRLWQIKAGAQSFDLPKSRLGANHWHLQMTKTSLGCFLGILGYFSVFLWRCLGSVVLANASSRLELRFAKVWAQGEPLAPRSDENKILAFFQAVWLTFFCFLVWVGCLDRAATWSMTSFSQF